MFKHICSFFLLLALCGCVIPVSVPSSSSLPPSADIKITITGLVDTLVPTLANKTVAPGATVETTEIMAETVAPPPSSTVQFRATPFIEYLYKVQPGSPNAIENFAHPESGCNWMGVGGQVFDLTGNPVANLVIKLTGTFEDTTLEMVALTGGALYLGPGGYEFKIADRPLASEETLTLIVFDSQGRILSDPVPIKTYDDCTKNFILVNFLQTIVIENGYQTYLPAVEMESTP